MSPFNIWNSPLILRVILEIFKLNTFLEEKSSDIRKLKKKRKKSSTLQSILDLSNFIFKDRVNLCMPYPYPPHFTSPESTAKKQKDERRKRQGAFLRPSCGGTFMMLVAVGYSWSSSHECGSYRFLPYFEMRSLVISGWRIQISSLLFVLWSQSS